MWKLQFDNNQGGLGIIPASQNRFASETCLLGQTDNKIIDYN